MTFFVEVNKSMDFARAYQIGVVENDFFASSIAALVTQLNGRILILVDRYGAQYCHALTMQARSRRVDCKQNPRFILGPRKRRRANTCLCDSAASSFIRKSRGDI